MGVGSGEPPSPARSLPPSLSRGSWVRRAAAFASFPPEGGGASGPAGQPRPIQQWPHTKRIGNWQGVWNGGSQHNSLGSDVLAVRWAVQSPHNTAGLAPRPEFLGPEATPPPHYSALRVSHPTTAFPWSPGSNAGRVLLAEWGENFQHKGEGTESTDARTFQGLWKLDFGLQVCRSLHEDFLTEARGLYVHH